MGCDSRIYSGAHHARENTGSSDKLRCEMSCELSFQALKIIEEGLSIAFHWKQRPKPAGSRKKSCFVLYGAIFGSFTSIVLARK